MDRLLTVFRNRTLASIFSSKSTWMGSLPNQRSVPGLWFCVGTCWVTTGAFVHPGTAPRGNASLAVSRSSALFRLCYLYRTGCDASKLRYTGRILKGAKSAVVIQSTPQPADRQGARWRAANPPRNC